MLKIKENQKGDILTPGITYREYIMTKDPINS